MTLWSVWKWPWIDVIGVQMQTSYRKCVRNFFKIPFDDRWIRVLVTEILEKFRSRTRKHTVTVRKRCWVLDRLWSDQSCPFPCNLNSSVKAKRSYAIRYLSEVIKPLCGNLEICLNYYFRLRDSIRMLPVVDRDRKWKMLFWIALFGRALEQFSGFQLQTLRAHKCT